jgi:hypothetical protein
MKRSLCLLLLSLFSMIGTQAQDIEVLPTITPTPTFDATNTSIVDAYYTVNNDTPQLGERIFVTLTVNTPADAVLLNWPELLGDEVMEVIEIGEQEIQEEELRTIYTQTTEAVLWDVGEYLSEEILINYRLGEREQSVPVRSFFAFVPSQIGENELNEAVIRPSRPPLDMPYIPPWAYYVAAGIVIFSVIIIARLIQLAKRDVAKVVSGSPAQIAIAQLEDLKLQKLPAAVVYPLVADSLREYLKAQFGIDAVEMTTAEISEMLRQANIFTQTQRNGLHQLLEQADLVKFARFQPDETTSTRLINYAIKWLRDAERHYQEMLRKQPAREEEVFTTDA